MDVKKFEFPFLKKCRNNLVMTEKSEISGAFCSTDIYKHTSCDENLQFEILSKTVFDQLNSWKVSVLTIITVQ